MAQPISEKQHEALTFIRDFVEAYGRAPTYQRIADAIAVTKSGAHRLVGILEQRGYVRRHANREACLELTDPLANFSTTDLIAELGRRGMSVPSAELANPCAGDGAAPSHSHSDVQPRQTDAPNVHECSLLAEAGHNHG